MADGLVIALAAFHFERQLVFAALVLNHIGHRQELTVVKITAINA